MAFAIRGNSLKTELKSAIPLFLVAAGVVLLDQVTKEIITRTVAVSGTVRVVNNFLEFSYAENTGAAFGTFGGKNGVFVVIGVLAIAFVLVYYRQFRTETWMKISLGLLLGGAIGNLTDRILYHYVRDFIRIRYWFLHPRWWPSFNIADAALCVGAAMLILSMLRRSRSEAMERKD